MSGLTSRPSRGRRLPRRRALPALAAALAFPLLVTACGGAPPKPGPDDSPAAYSGVGVDDDRIDYAVGKLEKIITEERDASGVPGVAVAVVHRGETVFARGFGVRDTTTGVPVDESTVFPLASVSKAVSATVVAAETAHSDVGWSTPVRDVLPDFALADPRITPMVTVGDLFAHRSGLPEHAGDDLEDLGFDRAEILRRLRELPLTPFRASYAYTNFGVTAAAEGVARAAGTPWDELGRERIFDPLGMADTSYSHEDLLSRPNRAVGHVRAGGDGAWTPAVPGRDPDAQSPAGGVSSSVTDMARWTAMVLADGRGPGGAEVVPAAALREALTPQSVAVPPQTGSDRPGEYGFGFTLGTTSSGRVQWGHSGAFLLGAGTSVLMLPSLELGIVTLTNAAPVGLAETINARFADLAQYGDPTFDWGGLYAGAFAPLSAPAGDLADEQPPADPTPSRPLDDLRGEYRNPYFGPLRIGRAGGALTLEVGRGRPPVPLRHWKGDTFAGGMSGEGWSPGSLGSVTFDGDTVRVDLLDDAGRGTFTRVRPSPRGEDG